MQTIKSMPGNLLNIPKGMNLLKCKASLHALQEGPEALSRLWPRRTQHSAQGETRQLALGIMAGTTRPWASWWPASPEWLQEILQHLTQGCVTGQTQIVCRCLFARHSGKRISLLPHGKFPQPRKDVKGASQPKSMTSVD